LAASFQLPGINFHGSGINGSSIDRVPEFLRDLCGLRVSVPFFIIGGWRKGKLKLVL
jgi:hypothetical protein